MSVEIYQNLHVENFRLENPAGINLQIFWDGGSTIQHFPNAMEKWISYQRGSYRNGYRLHSRSRKRRYRGTIVIVAITITVVFVAIILNILSTGSGIVTNKISSS